MLLQAGSQVQRVASRFVMPSPWCPQWTGLPSKGKCVMREDPPQHPTTVDRDAWRAYWHAQGTPWRTEPELDEQRQRFLAERRAIAPDIEHGIYPFREVSRASPEQRDWAAVQLGRASLREAHLEQAILTGAHLERATLGGAHLAGASLRLAYLQGTSLFHAHLEGQHMPGRVPGQGARPASSPGTSEDLPAASLQEAFLDSATNLKGTHLGTKDLGGIAVADVRWDGVNLGGADWSPVHMLGDEGQAHQACDAAGRRKDAPTRLSEYEEAVRANRQLAAVLRLQGHNEEADRFGHRAHVLQRQVSWRRRQCGRFLGSLLLDGISGYGYHPLRSVLTYLAVVGVFALVYLALGGAHGRALSWNEALVVSLTAFHGRGFFATVFQPGDPQAAVAAVEAVVGLLIEITFIATFTQRFFAR
jgi:hypothetical protein